MKKANLVILILLFCVSAEAQIKFNYGVETGMNFTATPQKITFADYYFYSEHQKQYSLPAPIFGWSINMYVRKHFAFSLNSDYKKMNHYFHDQMTFSYGNWNDTLDDYTNEFYHKICLPLTVGIQFGKRIHPTIYLGFGLNYFLKGNIDHYVIWHNDSSGVLSQSNPRHEYTNIFDKNIYPLDSRLKGQVTLGFNISLLKHFQIGTAAHAGGFMMRFPDPPPGDYEVDYASPSYLYANAEFDFTLKYYFKELYSAAPKKPLE